ncbi:MAG: tyrosine--tRNA ligase [bacterium]|nr:tyrosine--tRNA ligase [bacterium]
MPKIIIDDNKIKELLTRGVEEIFIRESLEKKLRNGKELRIKHGIDPTGEKIHLGRASLLWKLRQFQELGHKIVLIIGDFTAQIGDPSDKLAKRPFLSEEQIKKNMANYKTQVGKILDMEKVELRYNSEWLAKLTFQEIGQLAEIFTIRQMMARRNFKERDEKGEEVSLREFLYPLMQGYDSVAIKADVEIGGFDQLFNLKAGREIQKFYGQNQQDIMTTQMLEGTDNRKMSTSWENVINISDNPNEQFGKIMSMKDELILKYFLLCTQISRKEILLIEKGIVSEKLNPRDTKVRLAKEIVTMYHGAAEAAKAEKEFNKIFRDKGVPSEMPEIKISEKSLAILDLLVKIKLASSKSEAKRLVEGKAVEIDSKIISDWKTAIEIKSGMVIKAGKRKFAKIIL